MGFSGCEFIIFSCTLPSQIKCHETVLELDLKTNTFNVTEASCEMPVPSAFALMRKKETHSWKHLAANPLGTIFFLSLPSPLSTCLDVCKHSSTKAAPWIGGTFDFRVPFWVPIYLAWDIFIERKEVTFYLCPQSYALLVPQTFYKPIIFSLRWKVGLITYQLHFYLVQNETSKFFPQANNRK